jgi:hypothetical protein
VVEGDEEKAQGERERLHRSDDGGLLAEGMPLGARNCSDEKCGDEGEAEVSPRHADADQRRPRRARERNYGQRVADERLAAQDHEPPNGSGDDCGDGSGPERVRHEMELEELTDVLGEVPGQADVGAQHVWSAVQMSFRACLQSGVVARRLGQADDHGRTV